MQIQLITIIRFPLSAKFVFSFAALVAVSGCATANALSYLLAACAALTRANSGA